ncbi:DUF6635 family protein [Sedimentitalea sp. XS_ASV28]|uniref:DUF6635 family protein n=1 Tax=Sedimentitalea sp. XS_ASV28 TaxID=3241296 RepID=UPI00351630DA
MARNAWLNGAALGWDILRAPVNVSSSPVLVLTRSAAYLCRRIGWRETADWLSRRRVEMLVVTDLLDLARDPSALARRPRGTAVSRDDPPARQRRRG